MPRKVAIHAHVFYLHIWPEVEKCVSNFVAVCGSANVLLVVTYPKTEPSLRQLFDNFMPTCECRVVPVPNKGYDIGPFFVEFLNKIVLSRYDYIVKLHTKRDTEKIWCHFRPFVGSEWRDELLSFCNSKEAVLRTLTSFDRFPRLGMVASHRVINYSGSDSPSAVRTVRDMLQRKMSLHPRHLVMVSGTMFAVRAELLKFCQGRFTFGDFSSAGTGERAHKDYGLAGPLEFLFAMGVDAQGYVISAGIWPPAVALFGYSIQTAFFLLLRFSSDLTRKILGVRLFDRVLNAIQR